VLALFGGQRTSQDYAERACSGDSIVRSPVEPNRVVHRLGLRREPNELQIVLLPEEPAIARPLPHVLDPFIEHPSRAPSATLPRAIGLDEAEDMIELEPHLKSTYYIAHEYCTDLDAPNPPIRAGERVSPRSSSKVVSHGHARHLLDSEQLLGRKSAGILIPASRRLCLLETS